MTVNFSYKRVPEQSRWAKYVPMANRHASTLWEFAFDVAAGYTDSKSNQAEVERIREWFKGDFPGRDVDVEEVFPDVTSRLFWSRVFFDVAAKIIRRQLGNQDTQYWQSGAVHRAYGVALLLAEAARDGTPPLPQDRPLTIDEEDEAKWRADEAARYQTRRVRPSAEPPAP